MTSGIKRRLVLLLVATVAMTPVIVDSQSSDDAIPFHNLETKVAKVDQRQSGESTYLVMHQEGEKQVVDFLSNTSLPKQTPPESQAESLRPQQAVEKVAELLKEGYCFFILLKKSEKSPQKSEEIVEFFSKPLVQQGPLEVFWFGNDVLGFSRALSKAKSEKETAELVAYAALC